MRLSWVIRSFKADGMFGVSRGNQIYLSSLATQWHYGNIERVVKEQHKHIRNFFSVIGIRVTGKCNRM